MKEKRGQFFLIGAIIIIVILGTLFLYQNRIYYYFSEDKVLSLKNQLGDESSYVIDYGLYKKEEKLGDFIKKTSSNLISEDPNIELIFFYGNNTHLNVINLGTENITINISGVNYQINHIPRNANIGLGNAGTRVPIDLNEETIRQGTITIPISINQNKITFKIKEVNYEINLDRYKNFYFLIKREEGEEKDVAIG